MSTLGVVIAVVFLAAGIIAISSIAAATSTIVQLVYAKAFLPSNFAKTQLATEGQAPIATSGDNLYVVWWSNKTGNNEVMFKASIDDGKTFGPKINLSNTPKSNSDEASIAAAGNNVYVTWWEHNSTQTFNDNEPVMRVSNDNGKIFGQEILLSSK
jgi:uncharacterized protein (DUF1697 family)